MDIGTIAGMVGGFALICGAMLLGGSIMAFVSPASVLIVVGGTGACAFIMFSMQQVLGAMKVAANVFRVPATQPEKLIDRIVELSEVVRKEGLLALENQEINHVFLKRGINLAIDGTDPDLIDAMLHTEIAYLRTRHQGGQKIFKALAEMAPAFGMIGTLIGLVQMLQSLSDPSAIGPAMATALLTTLYGSIMANLIFTPMAKKLESRSEQETLALNIIASGIRSVTNGDFPRLARDRMESFLSGSQRKPEGEDEGNAEPAAAA